MSRRLSHPLRPSLSRRPIGVVLALAALVTTGGGWSGQGASAASTAPVAGARVLSAHRLSARVVELTIATPAFAAPTKVMVDLPTGYDAQRSRHWPVTYYLAGTNHVYSDFNNQYDGVALSARFPSLVVSPNGDSGYWSDWFNAGKGGPPRYETFVVDQLIPLIDRMFRTTASRSTRAVMGESMGGYGAMMLAARHPDLFAAASSLSGAVDSNLPANGAVLSASPVLQGASPDAIYGPRATQEVRWRGHNPTDLAANLRPVALQLRSAAGIVDPTIGEGAADAASCPVEAGVDMATTDLHQALTTLGIAHTYHRYPTGCHSVPNFERQITATFAVLAQRFASPAPTPTAFDYRAVDPAYTVFGWSVRCDRARALELLRLQVRGARSFTLTGSGRTGVVTPAEFVPHQRVRVTGASPAVVTADASGRVHLVVDLGPADTDQQYTPGARTVLTTRTVRLTPAVR